MSLDAADNDPMRFWSYVIAALDTLQPGVGATALALLQSPQPPPIEALLTPLLNALSAASPCRCAMSLVLDDYHLITAPAIHAALALPARPSPAAAAPGDHHPRRSAAAAGAAARARRS